MNRRQFLAGLAAVTVVRPQHVHAYVTPKRDLFRECANPRWTTRIPNVNVAARLAGRRW